MASGSMCFTIFWIIYNVCYTTGYSIDEEVVSRKLRLLSNTDHLIQADIQMIKTKVWVDIVSQIEQLTERLNHDEENRKQLQNAFETCGCTKTVTSSPRVENEIIGKKNILAKYASLLNGFQSEKTERRSNTNDIVDLKSNILAIDRKSNSLVGKSTLIANNTHALTINVQSNRDELVKIKDIVQNLTNDLNTFNATLESRSVDTNKFGKPGFNSGWILMKAQDPTLSEMTIPHGLGGLPYKVEVQIRPMSGPNVGMIFHGDSVFQSDDDTGKIYGGIVYLYDDKNIRVFAPKKNNNGDSASIINTGEQDANRLGKNHQVSKEALIRVKAWGNKDIIRPDFISHWISLDRTDQTKAFHEIEHKLNDYPAFLNVQIRCNSTDGYLVSEGVGASSMGRDWSNAGGVVWGFDDKLVRIWTAFITPQQKEDSKYLYYRLFGQNDGWGFSFFTKYNFDQGEARIVGWSRESMTINSLYSAEQPVTDAFLSGIASIVNVDNDLFSVYVQANDGINKGFRFMSYGNSQSIQSPFGGLVSAFSLSGQLRAWRPNPEKKGNLIHIHSPYGNGQCIQTSNNATIVTTLIKAG